MKELYRLWLAFWATWCIVSAVYSSVLWIAGGSFWYLIWASWAGSFLYYFAYHLRRVS